MQVLLSQERLQRVKWVCKDIEMERQTRHSALELMPERPQLRQSGGRSGHAVLQADG